MRKLTRVVRHRTLLSVLSTFCALSCPLVVQAQNKPASPLPQDVTRTSSAKASPFEETVARLFQSYTYNEDVHGLRIDPSVTAYLDPVTYSVEDASFETALTALLDSLKETPLTFRIEKGRYVITPKQADATGKAASTPLGLPSYHPTPIVKKASGSNVRLGTALQSLFEAAGVNYVFIQPFGVTASPRTDFAAHDMPVEQAVVHLLRSTPTEPLVYLQRKGIEGEPDKFIYVVSPAISPMPPFINPFSDGARKLSLVDFRYSFRLQRANLYEVLKVILAGEYKNYTLDPSLRKQKVTVSAENLILEDALAKLVAAASSPLMVKVNQDVYSVIPK